MAAQWGVTLVVGHVSTSGACELMIITYRGWLRSATMRSAVALDLPDG